MNWTKKDLDKLKLNNNWNENVPKKNVLLKKKTINGKISIEKETIKMILWVLHHEKIIPEYVEELQFHSVRKFRFDWAIPKLKIAIEYEGIVSKKSRHTTILGYSADVEKYNLAVTEGWKVLRYTALNYKNLENDIINLINL